MGEAGRAYYIKQNFCSRCNEILNNKHLTKFQLHFFILGGEMGKN